MLALRETERNPDASQVSGSGAIQDGGNLKGGAEREAGGEGSVEGLWATVRIQFLPCCLLAVAVGLRVVSRTGRKLS